MKLFFQCDNNRLAIDTEHKCYCTDYFYLGGWKTYITIKRKGMKDILDQLLSLSWENTTEGF